MRRSAGLAAVVVLLAVVAAAGCASHPTAAPGHSAVRPTASRHSAGPVTPVSIQLMLPSRTVTAGGQIAGHVEVVNNSGHPIRTGACGGLFTVALASRSYHPVIAVTTCVHLVTIPVGKSTYREQILATYLACSMRHASDGHPACLPGTRMPPLPPGSYRATLYFLVNRFAPAPPAIPVQVTRR